MRLFLGPRTADAALHEGTAYWRDGGVWQDAELSGESRTTYRSSLTFNAGALEYRAIYGRTAPHDEVAASAPLIYRLRPE